ncbi:hypothetical protein Tsubulata_004855 [Turnera subulata]|uniref:Fe2OG dioxygenase domain-containing protein n=1 Tax=Turnera subulata TaxID=218843 RepID=A0A9Q0JR13_9ROSI|nr:hypothetical protein Tsubulata_004855 [Turnera subulata]
MATSQIPTTSFDNFSSVPFSVQELIKQPLLSIPDQYILPNQEFPSTVDCASLPSIPTIDLKRLVSPETADLELQKLNSTCKDWGFFQLLNHGVNSVLLNKLKYEVEEFYRLPLEQKMKYKTRPGEAEGYGPIARPGTKLDWGDRLYMISNPTHRRNPRLIPELPSSLRTCLESYLLEMQQLAMKLLGFMASALKMDMKEMEMFDDGLQSVRFTYYPPCPQPEKVVGLTPHSDPTGITILNQINGVDGLQIKRKGSWFPVSLRPDAFVVNVGDILEILSNGVYKSIEHRATVNSGKERISVAFFVNPKFEAEVGPAASLINSQNPPMFKRKGVETYVKDFFSRPLNGKSFLENMKLEDDQEAALDGN